MIGEEDEAAPKRKLIEELITAFTAAEPARITEFLRLTNEVGKRHLDRLTEGELKLLAGRLALPHRG